MNFENQIGGGVWACAPVSERPEIVMTDWHVFEVCTPLPRTRHFAGQNITEGEGRVSSPILEFDAATRRGVTRSGRVYELRGSPGFTADGSYTWNRWKAIHGALEVVDVTAEVRAEMEQAL